MRIVYRAMLLVGLSVFALGCNGEANDPAATDDVSTPATEEAEQTPAEGEEQANEEESGSANPFGPTDAGADPFGGAAPAEPAAEADPFGDARPEEPAPGADPFGDTPIKEVPSQNDSSEEGGVF